MNNGKMEPRRGDVWWMKDGMSVGSEEGFHRPYLIVSSDKGNETAPTLLVVSLTSTLRRMSVNVPTRITGKENMIQCNQVFSFDKSRLVRYVGSLSEKEMEAVDEGLLSALGMRDRTFDTSQWDEEKRELVEEIESLKTQLAKQKDSETKDTVSKDMWKRLYEKALDELVSVRIALDLSERTNKPEPKVENVVVEAPKVEEPEPKVEINTCTEEDLRRIGCNATISRYIATNRPYKSVDELKRIPQMTRFAYQILESKICCVPVIAPKKEIEKVEPKVTLVAKVNVNTATAKEMQAAGLPKGLSEHIRAYRNKHGAFGRVEDLLNVSRFGTVCLKKYGDRLEV